jgi:uncharacterized protein
VTDAPAAQPPIEAPPSPPALATPIGAGERIESIDVLRGVALLGILAMNIQSFAMIGAAYFNPTAYGDLTGANWLVWYVCRLIADQKFMTIFSMLFGAGIVVFTTRSEQKRGRSAGLHYRRMGWLILFGLLHAHLLWYGDILYSYGMCGMIAYLFRRLRPSWLIAIGFVLILVASLLSCFFGWAMGFVPEEVWAERSAEILEGWQPDAATIQKELDAYRGSWLGQMPRRMLGAATFETFVFLIFVVWRVTGLMLVGMALLKLGVLSAKRSTGFYATLVAIAALVGVPIVAWGVHRSEATDWDYVESFFFIAQYNYWASIIVSFGWIGLVMLICRAPIGWIMRPFAAVGRMAFTNYIAQTVICTTIFYGHGFGLFGEVSRVGQLGVVLAVWAVLLVISPIWLRFFRFGPLEWLWRSLSYWRRQPMRREGAT